MIVTELHGAAKSEFVRATRHFQKESDRLAERFVNAVFEAREQIRSNPLAGSPYQSDYRFVKTKRFRYILYYDYDPKSELVFIYAVAHASRRPGYWLRRTRKP